jgi:hypothetical protein
VSVPGASDDVFFDGVGTGNSPSTISAAISIKSLDMTGYANTLTHNAVNLTIAGNGGVFKLASGMTYTITTGGLIFTGTSGTTLITTAGKTLPGPTFSGVGGTWQLQDAATTTGGITFTAGTLDTNNMAVAAVGFASNSSSVRTLTLGSSIFTLTGGGSALGINDATNLTITANTGTFYLKGGSVNTVAKDFNGLSLLSNTNLQLWTITSPGSIFKNITFSSNQNGQTLFLGGDIILTGTLNVTGVSTTSRMMIVSSAAGTARTITAANVALSYVDLSDISAAGAANWNLASIPGNSGDMGGNSGITFTPAQDNYWVSGTGNWNDSTKWKLSNHSTAGRVPLPQDGVRFDASSFTAGSQTVTLNMARAGKSIDWTGVTNTPAWAKTTASTIYGSVTLVSGMTNSGTTAITMGGRGAFTFTSAGQTWTNPLTIAMIGGSLALQDNFNSSATSTLTNGTLDANNFNVTVPAVSITGASTRTLTMGSGIWTATSTGNVWDATATTSLTMNSNTSTIVIPNTTATAKNFIGGWLTYNNTTFSGDNIIVGGSNTFNTIAVNTAGLTNGLKLTSGSTQTISNLTTNGFALNLAKLVASTTGSAATLSKSSGTVSVDYMSIQDITATGGASWHAGTNSTNVSGNTGWSFISTTVPTVSIQAATTATTSTALNGTIEAIGDSTPTIRGFNFGTTIAYGTATSTTGSYGTGAYSLGFNSLSCGTTYHVQAFATNAAGTGTSSDLIIATTACPTVPSAPQSLSASAGNGQATLTWSVSTSTGGVSITDYLVEYKQTANSTWLTFNDGISLTRNAIVTGLTASTSYDFRVSAINSIGTSTPSATSTVFASMYNLSSGPYSVQDLGIVLSTNSIDRPFYFQLNGDTHFVAFYEANYGTTNFQIYDVNMTQGTAVLTTSASLGRLGTNGTVLYSNGKIYISSGEANGLSYFSEYNPTTHAVRQIAQTTGSDPGQYDEIGDDGWIYIGGYPNAFVDRYNPNTDVYERLNTGTALSSYAYTLGADTRYVYIGVGESPWYLAIYDTQTQNTTLYYDTANDSLGTVWHGTNGNWYYQRYNSTPTYQTYWYQLINGVPVALPQYTINNPPPFLLSQAKRGNVVSGTTNGSLVGYEVNLDNALPDSSNNNATINYRTVGAPTWQSVTVGGFQLAPTGIHRLFPWDSTHLLSFASFYGPVFTVNKSSIQASILGYPQFNLYDFVASNGISYFSGYTAGQLHYDPSNPWTLSASTPNKFNTSVNPYQTGVAIGKHEYYEALGSDGYIYVGALHERDSVGGEVGWYNPSNGTTGSLRAPFVNDDISDLKPALSGTKLVYASKGQNLFVIDTATKSVERTIVPLPGTNMNKVVEVAPGIMFGATGNTIFEVNIADGSLIYSKTLIDAAFMESGRSDDHRLVRGPDGYIWMFRWYRNGQGFNVSSLYRINPADGSYTTIITNTYYTYGENNVMFDGGDMYWYGGTHLYRIAGILSEPGALLPVVSTTATSPISAFAATLNGSIDDIGGSSVTTRGFNYGISTTTYDFTTSTTGSYSAGAFTANLTGLACNTTYHFRAYATNSSGNGASADSSFTTSACPVTIATVSSSAATSLGSSTATLHGSIDVDGTASSTSRGFNYGLTSAYGTTVSTTGTYGIGSFTANLTGLTCATTYHFQAFATNPSGTGSAADNTFTTNNCAVVANNISTPTGLVISSVTNTSVSLSWNVANADLGIAGYNIYRGGVFVAFLNSGTIYTDTGLTRLTSYSYTVTAVDLATNESTASDAISATTVADVPTVSSVVASSISGTGATLNGSITNTGGQNPTSRGFVWGTSTSYGATTTDTGSYGISDFNTILSSLTCNSTYHFNAYATNSGGTGYGSDQSVTTSACPVTSTPSSGGGSSSGGGGSAQSQMNNLIAMGSPSALLAYVNQNRALLLALQAQGQQLPPQVLALLSPTITMNSISPNPTVYSTITYLPTNSQAKNNPPVSSVPPLSPEAISSLKGLPSEFLTLIGKFPELGRTILSLSKSAGSNIVAKLKGAKLTLPGLSKEAGSSTGVPLASLTPTQKKSLPSEVVFAKAGDLIDYNVSLAISDTGAAEQTIHTVAGKSIDLALKPDKPVKTITGYLTIKNIDRQAAMKAIPANSMLTASIGSLLAQSSKEAPVVDSKLVLQTFTYTDPDHDGIYTAHIDAPQIHGEYDIMTIMEYKDAKLGSKEFHLTTVVDPEGYVYKKSGSDETRIHDAKISIFWKNPKTSAFELWPATNYKQVNPQKTDATGMYSFLVPEGTYKLTVTASGYYDYNGAEFNVVQGSGIHENIEMKSKHWWTNLFSWFASLI